MKVKEGVRLSLEAIHRAEELEEEEEEEEEDEHERIEAEDEARLVEDSRMNGED